MYIFLDTNIYHNNWLLKSPLFVKLISYCNDTDVTLLLPEIVVLEVQAKHGEERGKLLAQIEKDRRAAEGFGITLAEPTSQFVEETYDFGRVVMERFHHVARIPFDKIEHSILVRKAIDGTRPFRGSEKGYRDALIWHSLLRFLAEFRADESVAFITNNSSDFFDTKDNKVLFHGDLQKEVREAGLTCDFLLFNSLLSFLKEKKAVRQGTVDQERLVSEMLPTLEEAAEQEALEYLNSLPVVENQRLFLEAGLDAHLTSMLRGVEWSIVEATEDPDLGPGELVQGSAVFVPYEFNLRILEATWQISTPDYLQNKAKFDASWFYNADSDPTMTFASVAARCYFRASFIVDAAETEVLASAIDKAWLRPYS